MRVLVVEDDLSFGAALQRSLEQEGYAPVWVRRLKEAREHAKAEAFAIIVLDINLPDGEGFTLLDELRRGDERTPVLIMTARDELDDRLRGLDGGADDYLVKPFAMAELLARLRAVARRHAGFASDVWRIGDLQIDPGRREVRLGETAVTLTPSEFALLSALARQAGRVVAKETLLQSVWGGSGDGTDAALEYQVHQLRRKIGAERIRTLRGAGYLLETQ